MNILGILLVAGFRQSASRTGILSVITGERVS
jgi:hypothetical protein